MCITVKEEHKVKIFTDMKICAHLRATSRLGGVAVSVLATGLKGCGFGPGQGDVFLRAIKFRSTSSILMGSKARRPML
jgi:hypothetical protein